MSTTGQRPGEAAEIVVPCPRGCKDRVFRGDKSTRRTHDGVELSHVVALGVGGNRVREANAHDDAQLVAKLPGILDIGVFDVETELADGAGRNLRDGVECPP